MEVQSSAMLIDDTAMPVPETTTSSNGLFTSTTAAVAAAKEAQEIDEIRKQEDYLRQKENQLEHDRIQNDKQKEILNRMLEELKQRAADQDARESSLAQQMQKLHLFKSQLEDQEKQVSAIEKREGSINAELVAEDNHQAEDLAQKFEALRQQQQDVMKETERLESDRFNLSKDKDELERRHTAVTNQAAQLEQQRDLLENQLEARNQQFAEAAKLLEDRRNILELQEEKVRRNQAALSTGTFHTDVSGNAGKKRKVKEPNAVPDPVPSIDSADPVNATTAEAEQHTEMDRSNATWVAAALQLQQPTSADQRSLILQSLEEEPDDLSSDKDDSNEAKY